jgi:hypothetical protein
MLNKIQNIHKIDSVADDRRNKRASLSCKEDDHKIEELLRCRLGNVSIGVFAPLELHKDLSMFCRQMKDFLTNEPVSLRLYILRPKIQRPNNSPKDRDESTKPFSLNRVQDDSKKAKQQCLMDAKQHFNRLLSDPLAYDCYQGLAPDDVNVSFIPMTAAFLCANPVIGEALLLLQKEWHTQSICRSFSLAAHASMTAVNAIMAYLAVYMAQQGDGVVAHGVGVNFQDKGYLFLAPSEGGKTTLAMHSKPGSVLADDGIIIREHGDGYRLYPTPMRQKRVLKMVQQNWHSSPVMLKAVFLLKKSSQTCIASADRAQTFGRLINAMTHFFMWMQPQQATQVFDFWHRLSLTVPMAEFEWRLKSEIWTLIDNFLQKE